MTINSISQKNVRWANFLPTVSCQMQLSPLSFNGEVERKCLDPERCKKLQIQSLVLTNTRTEKDPVEAILKRIIQHHTFTCSFHSAPSRTGMVQGPLAIKTANQARNEM